MGLFNKKKEKITEDQVRIEPAEKVIDVIKLCERCPFIGQCGFKDGCASFQQIVKDREEYLAKIRGFDPSTNPEPPSNRSRMPRYLVGISWREHGECGKGHWVIYRVTDCNSTSVKISIKDSVLFGDRNRDVSIEMPFVDTKDGSQVVDILKLRNDARKAYTGLGRQ